MVFCFILSFSISQLLLQGEADSSVCLQGSQRCGIASSYLKTLFFYCHGSIPSRSSRTLFMIYWLCSSRKPKVKWQLPDVPTEHPDSNDMSWLYSNRTPEVKWLCPTLPVLLSSQVKFLKQCIFAKHQNLPWKNINTRDQLCSKDSFVYNILYICKKKNTQKNVNEPLNKDRPSFNDIFFDS